MSAKRAMGADPLDALVPAGKSPRKRTPAAPPAEEEAPPKAKASFNLSPAVMELARNAAWWGRLTMAELAEEALRREVARLAKKAGHPEGVFPPRERELKSGRPTR